jgi:hypothetical protein
MLTKTSNAILTAGLTLPVLMLAACTNSGEDSGPQYCAPEAYIGSPLSVALGSDVELDASAEVALGEETVVSGYPADCDQSGADELVYSWDFMSVPTDSALDKGGLTDNNSPAAALTSFTPDVVGTYVLNLVVHDELESSEPAIVVINVSAGDAAPVADAGPDLFGETGVRVDLDGSASSDPEGAELEYSWAVASTPSCSGLAADDLYNQGTVSPSFICDCEGIYTIALVVSDGTQWSEPDYATVSCDSGDLPPVADAGDSGAMAPCEGETVHLNGFGSYDPDGEPLTYSWGLVSAPAESTATDANFSDASAPDPTFTWDVPGDYSFQLQVFDGVTWSAPDVVYYTMQGTEANQAPFANAGSADSVSTTADCERLSYTEWDCDDCPAFEIDLDGSGSWDPDGDDLNYHWSDASGETTIESPYTAATVVATPVIAAEYNVTTAYTWDLELTVADCADSDTDVVQLSISCAGEGK